MNFLAHFVLAGPREVSDDFLIGSLLPDISKRAGILITPSKLNLMKDESLIELTKGIQFHWFADKLFHNSSLFEMGISFWKDQLEGALPDANRKFFLYHLLFEMWLDRLILLRDLSLGSQMYQTLNQVEFHNLDYLASSGFEDSQKKLVRTYQGFIERRFILEYENVASFTRISTEVFASVTKQPRQKEWDKPIHQSLKDLEPFEARVLLIWDEFKQNLAKEWPGFLGGLSLGRSER